MSLLELNQVSKAFVNNYVIDNVSLSLEEGQILCLLGPSGCGKTTLLRVIAGLDSLDAGTILFAGQDMATVPPYQRNFGLMFQEFALFPHKNVRQNVSFGLQMTRQADILSHVKKMLTLVGLDGFEERDVSSLSGGERQRVALARSLAPNPRLLMLDEPLGALDRALRERLMLETRQILKAVGLTAIYVTHDQSEAFAVADRIIVMNKGHVEQDATPEQLYHWPASPYVANFLGFRNLLDATWVDGDLLETSLGLWPIKAASQMTGQRGLALIRPEAASLSAFDGAISVDGELVNVLFRGRFYQITVSTATCQLTFEMPLSQIPLPGSQLTVWLDPTAILFLQAQT